jgi:hypothetical protein
MTKQERKNELRAIQLDLNLALVKQDHERLVNAYLRLEDLINAHGLYLLREPKEPPCPILTSN